MSSIKSNLYNLLRWSEKYTKTDMVYLARSGVWTNLGTVTLSLFSLILYIVFARVVPAEVYGTYQYLLSLVSIIGAFTLTGMSLAVTRSVARGYEGAFQSSIGVQLRFGLLPFIVSVIGGIYYIVQGNWTLGIGLIIIGIGVPLNSTFNTYSAYLIGKKDFKRPALYNIATQAFYHGALIAVAFVSPIALVFLAVNLFTQTIGLLISHFRTLHIYHPNKNVESTTFSDGAHLSVMSGIAMVVGQMDNVFVFHFLGAAPLALYSFATAIPERISGLLKFIPTAAFPKLAASPEKARSIIGPRMLWAIPASAAVILAYGATAPIIFKLLFPAYTAAVPYSQFYALIILSSLTGLLTTALTARRNLPQLYIFNIASPIMQFLLQGVGIILFGLWGLIGARVLASFLSFGLAAALLLFQPRSINPEIQNS